MQERIRENTALWAIKKETIEAAFKVLFNALDLTIDELEATARFCRMGWAKKNAYGISQVQTILEKLHSSRFLSVIDIAVAYWAVPVGEVGIGYFLDLRTGSRIC